MWLRLLTKKFISYVIKLNGLFKSAYFRVCKFNLTYKNAGIVRSNVIIKFEHQFFYICVWIFNNLSFYLSEKKLTSLIKKIINNKKYYTLIILLRKIITTFVQILQVDPHTF
jgi:hypothetical protein